MKTNFRAPKILITNDDGISAKGLHALVDFVADRGDVRVVAPDGARSGMSGAITSGTPLFLYSVEYSPRAFYYVCNGTPVDCVKLALHVFTDWRPDLILSGINHGSNSGASILYSGTMGAVLESCVVEIPAVGFSLLSRESDADFSPCRDYVDHIVSRVLAEGLPRGVCLNVNFPAVPMCGLRVCRQARGCWTEEYNLRRTADGREGYYLSGYFVNAEPDAPDTDEYLLAQGYATVVPCLCDQTAYGALSNIENLLK